MLHNFDSIPEYIAKVKSLNTPPLHKSLAWTGRVTFEQALERAIKGDNKNVPKAMALLDNLAESIPPTKSFQIVKSTHGGRCNFGDWQAGAPLPMRRRVRSLQDMGPLKIVVSTTSSEGISSETMENRGIVILALLLRLQEIRPVDLYLLAELCGDKDGWSYQFIRVDSRPLDISVASFVLSNVGFARQLTYHYARVVDSFNGMWPRDYHQGSYAQTRRERLGLADSDMVVGEVHLTDELVNTPKIWLAKQIEKYGGEQQT